MYSVMGISGQVGGAAARSLLAKGSKVKAVVRDATKATTWAQRGCEIAVADVNDSGRLEDAFQNVDGVFVMLPPTFDPTPGFPEAHAAIKSLRQALLAARPRRTVVLSTIGGHVTRPNLLNQLHVMEEEFSSLPLSITFLRPGWFMENSSWDVKPARETGLIQSFLQPLDKAFPMVATEDIGHAVAELLHDSQTGHRVVELEGPARVTPNEIAATFGRLIGRDVRMEVVPRDRWESLFRAQGMNNPTPRMQMLDGFNEGWIEFESGEAKSRKGETHLETVLGPLTQQNQ